MIGCCLVNTELLLKKQPVLTTSQMRLVTYKSLPALTCSSPPPLLTACLPRDHPSCVHPRNKSKQNEAGSFIVPTIQNNEISHPPTPSPNSPPPPPSQHHRRPQRRRFRSRRSRRLNHPRETSLMRSPHWRIGPEPVLRHVRRHASGETVRKGRADYRAL